MIIIENISILWHVNLLSDIFSYLISQNAVKDTFIYMISKFTLDYIDCKSEVWGWVNDYLVSCKCITAIIE